MKDEKTGEDLVSIGFVVDLDYADATTSAHDLLQQFKTHPLVRRDPRGRRARRLGRQGAAGRRLLVDAEAVDARRGARRRRRRHGRHGGAEGRPPLHQVGHARRRGDLRGAQARRAATSRAYEQAVERLHRSARSSTRCATRASRSRRASSSAAPLSGPVDHVQGQASAAGARSGTATTPSRCSSATRKDATPSPTASTPSTSSRRSSSPATRRATTRRTTSACRSTSRARSPRRGAGCARPASTRSPRTRPSTATVDVIVNYTNCVQCGAITAKGGRLTPPEGGDGPLYQIT